jgi:SAM-dependent methyltransferase
MPMTARAHIAPLYPEVVAGGFSRVDGTVQFYARVNALLAELVPESVVLDFGAGRGAFLENPSRFVRQLRDLSKSPVKVIGVDVDCAVLENPSLDEAIVVAPGERLPLGDESVDLIVSDFTFEHIEQPLLTAQELERVLRPGGWLCARTPHKWGYIGLGARAIPNAQHHRLLRVLAPRQERDVFPTHYRLNTHRALRRSFPVSKFEHYTYGWGGEPAYVAGSAAMARFVRLATALTPNAVQPRLFIFLRKRSSATTRD